MKTWRQSQILDVIDREPVVSQEILRQKLRERGIDATQATLSRDLQELTATGFEVAHARGFDMFPQTAHMEAAVLMIRK